MMIITATQTWSTEAIELFVLGTRDVSDGYVGWLNDIEINRFLESRFVEHTLDSTRQFVEGCLASDKTLLLGIRSRPLGGRHVGNIKIEINAHHKSGEIGILVGDKRVHGKGVATQSIKIVAAIAREQLQLRRVTAGCYASNKGSERAFVKAGFTIEGVRPGHFLLAGHPEDLTLMGCSL
jgi:ribosomal-protein-alanine N-acetyltransferase